MDKSKKMKQNPGLKEIAIEMCEQVQLADDKKHWENINTISFYRSWWVFATIFKEKRKDRI